MQRNSDIDARSISRGQPTLFGSCKDYRQDTHEAGRVLVAKLMRIIDRETPSSARIRIELIERQS